MAKPDAVLSPPVRNPVSNTRRNIRAAELVTPDHWPVCAKCGDYSESGAMICQSCSSWLVPPEFRP